MAERILATAALPYANGPIHLGHVLEHLQVDVFVRALRLMGREAVFLCADDTHGTAIEIRAAKEGITPEALIERCSKEHVADFKDFLIHHDHYGSTNSDANRKYAELFYTRLKEAGHIIKAPVDQMYCEKDRRYLPDRYIRGTCPRCKTQNQYGDSCESCGATYTPADLIEPKCSLCGTPPIVKASHHVFYDLPKMGETVKAWTTEPGHVQDEVRAFIDRWYQDGLRPWDISRDGPYFGFRIPGEEDQYFYVWLDAPIGYVSITEQYCDKVGWKFDDFWGPDAKNKIFHFIGKDIIYFHVLFWPAMLMDAKLHLPAAVNVHGMLTMDGTKLSKSRGTFINARTYLKHLPPEPLRYYLANKLTPKIDDVDINLDDFLGTTNSHLVNNFSNLYSRAFSVIGKQLGGRIPKLADVRDAAARDRLLTFEKQTLAEVGKAYEDRDFGAAVKKILELSDFANKYIQDQKPWEQARNDPKAAGETLSVALNAGKLVAVALQPILPKFADTVARMLAVHSGDSLWQPTIARDGRADLGGDTVYGPFVRLFERIERKQLDAIIDETREEAGGAKPAPAAAAEKHAEKKKKAKEPEGPPPTISIDDFAKLDLRVGLIKDAGPVEGADKLVRLTVDLGPLGTRNVFAGIRKSYEPEKLKGRKVIVLANLAPRQMKFGVSEAMVLAADDGDFARVLLPDGDVEPGSKVR